MIRKSPSHLISLVAASIFLAGCGDATVRTDVTESDGAVSDARDVESPDIEDPNLLAPGHCDDASVRLLRVNPWMGGGLQIWLAGVTDPAAVDGGVSAPVSDGITGILLEPSADADIHARRLTIARNLVQSMPVGERVGLWVARHDSAPLMMCDFIDDRVHLAARIDQIQPASVVTGLDDIDAIRGLLAGADGRWGTVLKRVVVISGGAPVRVGTDPVPSIAISYIVDGVAQPATLDHVATVVADIQADRAGVMRVGMCPSAVENQEFTLAVGDAKCVVAAPKPADHLANLACIADDAAADRFDFGDTIELVMTESEKAAWDRLHADRSKDDFTLSVRLGVGEPIPASAHFRGQTSMDCQRKNYDVNLAGGQSRRLMVDGGGDEFYLISMCKDEGYFNQVFANRMLSEWGIFPLKSRLVRLRLNGENHGLYLMMQEPSDTLVKRHAALQGVIRRPFDPDPRELLEVKYAAFDDIAGTLQMYLDMVEIAQDVESISLAADLANRLDLAMYLRWMAAMTFMHNGDYVDEIFFYGSVEAGGVPWWRPMNWDADDLFSTCHHGGVNAKTDPWGMLYCAEGFIDDSIVGSPEIYDAWVEQLESVMTDVSAERALYLMNGVRDDLFALLDDETAAALVEFHGSHPAAVTGDGAKAEIQGLMDSMLASIEQNRGNLAAKIGVYRGGQGQ